MATYDVEGARAAGVSDEEINEVLEEAGLPLLRESPGALESLGHGVWQGATAGMAPRIGAAVGAGGIGGEEYERLKAESMAEHEAMAEENPWSYYGGQVVGSLVPGGIVAKGLATAGRAIPAVGRFLRKPFRASAATGGGVGAVEGAGRSEAETWGGVAEDAALGATAGAVLGPAAEGALRAGAYGARALGGAAGRAGRTAGQADIGWPRYIAGDMPQRMGQFAGEEAERAGTAAGRGIGGALERWRGMFDPRTEALKRMQGGPGPKEDFIQQKTSQAAREAKRTATVPDEPIQGRAPDVPRETTPDTGEAWIRPSPVVSPGREAWRDVVREKAPGRERQGIPIRRPDDASPQTDIRDVNVEAQASPTGLPRDVEIPSVSSGKQAWMRPHMDVYEDAPLTRQRALELMAIGGRPTSSQELIDALKMLGRPESEAVRRPFDVSFARRTAGKRGEMPGDIREMTGHLGINKYVTGEGMDYDPVKHNLINVWEAARGGGKEGYRMVPVDTLRALTPGSGKGISTWRYGPEADAEAEAMRKSLAEAIPKAARGGQPRKAAVPVESLASEEIKNLRALIDANGGTAFVRWSRSPTKDIERGYSLNYSGGAGASREPGLSAKVLTSDMSDSELLEQVSAYEHFSGKPHLFTGLQVGRDADGAASITNAKLIGDASKLHGYFKKSTPAKKANALREALRKQGQSQGTWSFGISADTAGVTLSTPLHSGPKFDIVEKVAKEYGLKLIREGVWRSPG